METLPEFDDRGALPPGIHTCTWEAFCARFGSNPHRQRVLGGLCEVLRLLGRAGCTAVYINGSFITARNAPRDFDGCWDPTDVDLEAVPAVLWELDNHRAAQKAAYGGELFPLDPAERPEDTWLHFFQHDRDGLRKGIVRLDPREVA
jgi:hypothetical protein